MQLKKMVFTGFLLIAIMAAITTAGMAQPMRYEANLYCNFQKERTIGIVFDPQVGNQKARVFEGPAKVSPAPPSPPGGELVDLEKHGDKWTYKRNSALRSATIKKDESGKLTIFYFTRGSNYAEGELKPVQ